MRYAKLELLYIVFFSFTCDILYLLNILVLDFVNSFSITIGNAVETVCKVCQYATLYECYPLNLVVVSIPTFVLFRYILIGFCNLFSLVKNVYENEQICTKYGENVTDKCAYYDFSPINLKNEKHYLLFKAQLDSYLSNDNVKNLAIFGDYGTGKSSLIETYFSPKNKYSDTLIKVSLPDFSFAAENIEYAKSNSNFCSNSEHKEHTDAKLKSDPDKKTVYDKQTEKSGVDQDKTNQSDRLSTQTVENEILRQILFSSLSQNIPISLISKFKVEKSSLLQISFFFCVLFICSLSIAYNSGSTTHVILVLFFESHFYSVCAWLDFIFCVYSVFLYLSKRFKISNLSFQSIGVNVKDKSDNCIIDSYIDELTYLFEESKCKYVLFEDLDRTDNKEVLTHLRNLNQILNNDARCKKEFSLKKRRIVFIYVLKRDIFINSSDSVKFFDAALNVTPFVSTVNSWSFMKRFRRDLFSIYQCENKKYFFSNVNLTDDFLKGISLYLTDLRLIKDIFNDYRNLVELYSDLFIDISESGKLKKWAYELFSYATFRCSYPLEYQKLTKNFGTTYYLLNRLYENLKENNSRDNLSSKNNGIELKKLTAEKSFYEIVKSDSFNPNLIENLKNNDILRFLIINNYLSESYRIFQVTYPSNLERKNISFLFSLVNNDNEYNPEKEISVEGIEIILHYFPLRAFNCLSVINYSFFRYLTYLTINTGEQKYSNLLKQYLTYYLKTVVNAQKYINSTINETQEDIGCFIIKLALSMRSSDLTNNTNMSCYLLKQLFLVSKQQKFSFPQLKNKLNTVHLIKNQEYVFLLFFLSIGYKSYSYQYNCDNLTIKSIDLTNKFIRSIFKNESFQNQFQLTMIEYSDLINEELFSSFQSLGIKFEKILDKLDMSNEDNRFFIISLINQVDNSNSRKNSFYFDLNWNNCIVISKYLRNLYQDVQININHPEKNVRSVLTSFITVTSSSIRIFDYYFYKILFLSNNYANLLIISGVLDNINNSDFCLLDEPEVVFFVVSSLYSSFLKDYLKFRYHYENAKEDIEKFELEENYLHKFQDVLEEPLLGYLSKYHCDQELSKLLVKDEFLNNKSTDLFDNFFSVLNCFLDFERSSFDDFKLILNTSWESPFSYRSVWSSILDSLNNSILIDDCSSILSIAHLLNFSLSTKNNYLHNKQHLIIPTIDNIEYLKKFVKEKVEKSDRYINKLIYCDDPKIEEQLEINNFLKDVSKYCLAVLSNYEVKFSQFEESSKDSK